MKVNPASGEPLPAFGAVADIDPYSYYEALRERGPIFWDEREGAWMVTGYDLCRQIEYDEQKFRHPYADADETLIDIKGGRRNVTILQGAEHSAMHRFLLRFFSPKLIDQYRTDHIDPTIDFLLN